jgi:hypothetical protein
MEVLIHEVREPRDRLREVLRAVESGKRVHVVSGKKIVAKITRPDVELSEDWTDDKRKATAVERKLRRLARQGKVRLNRRSRIRPYRVPRVEGLWREVVADRG